MDAPTLFPAKCGIETPERWNFHIRDIGRIFAGSIVLFLISNINENKEQQERISAGSMDRVGFLCNVRRSRESYGKCG